MIADLIKQKIIENLAPQQLEIINESDKHIGHAGHDGSGQSHFKLIVVSKKFLGLNRIQRQRLVYGFLAEEFSSGLHALSLKTYTPEEYNKR